MGGVWVAKHMKIEVQVQMGVGYLVEALAEGLVLDLGVVERRHLPDLLLALRHTPIRQRHTELIHLLRVPRVHLLDRWEVEQREEPHTHTHTHTHTHARTSASES
jgi:hypothetical protein